MTKRHGINKYSDKERREIRRRNHLALDLQKSRYHQRKIQGKNKIPPCIAHDFEVDEEDVI